MRILICGDAVTPTGFSRCTHSLADAAHAVGHAVSVLAINYYGDPHPYPYAIYPSLQPIDGGHDRWGTYRLPRLVDRLRPDVVVLLNDPWNVPAYLESLGSVGEDVPRPVVVGWLAVDAKNQRGAALNALDHVVAWTEFGADELRSGGYAGTVGVVPLGVDRSRFRPLDRAESRRETMPDGLPEGAFIVGVVGRNQSRKRLDLSLAYFAEWVREDGVEDAYLYLHVAPTGEGAFDVVSLARYHGLSGRVILRDPGSGFGDSEEHMTRLYSALDVYLSTTQGEGWGLPALEAMACGVPCILPDYSAFGDWARDGAILVPCHETATTAPLNHRMFTVGGVPDRRETVRALRTLHDDLDERAKWRVRARRCAARYDWTATGEATLREVEAAVVRAAGLTLADSAARDGDSSIPSPSAVALAGVETPGMADSGQVEGVHRGG